MPTTKLQLSMVAGKSFRVLRVSADISAINLETDELLGKLPGLALREMDVVLGMLLIG